ncbi:hypothetical protein SEA_FIREMAN_91 [Microbacterium phage Fireman]|uniref:Uncharacterized protein n=2 Tax=Metamorphoovirus TaxID=2733195 RepID=A0A481VWT8_9CAUD|nr:hypothetical protein HOT43_gp96 [Microbacterium phage RobsFeet]YP_009820328.1 hypothetical protein HOV22_gp93 [Microbacterium phage Fireman]AWY06100.1 hypothetical protein SEA_ROBSFEET_94 [Microbacterium phage RobsFeet]QBI98173.1 hypothetical protein SEA_FIREMAN_91 [Microbacterium phage Fireman]
MSEPSDISLTEAATGGVGIWAYTIYDHPADYPDQFVIRAWFVENGAVTAYEPVALADTLEDARALIPQGRERVPRTQADDPVIVESWV